MARFALISFLLASTVAAANPAVVEVFVDKGDVFVRAGKNRGLKVGAEVVLLGETIANTKERRRVGTAAVMEVWDTIARIRPDSAASNARFALVESAERKSATPAATKSTPAPTTQKASGTSNSSLPGGKSQVSSSGFSDQLIAQCDGIGVRVGAKSTLTGGKISLFVNNELVDSGDVSVGSNLVLNGKTNGKDIVLRVGQGLVSTDYSLMIDGKKCGLHDR